MDALIVQIVLAVPLAAVLMWAAYRLLGVPLTSSRGRRKMAWWN